jgi:hypothetical protein
MRLPSLDRVIATAGHAARRFPLVLICAVVAAAAGMLLIDIPGGDDLLERVLYVSTLGLPLFVGLTLLAERRGWSLAPLLLARLGGVLLLAGLFFVRPAWSDPVAFLRYVQLSVGFHLFVAFAPYLGVGELKGFWQYNRTLFLRALTTAVFAVVLFAGLAGALAAVDNLLGVDVEELMYGRLWFVIAFVFSTWFFLGGVPEDLAELETRTDYPAVIKVFSQFILTPIVTVYLGILTVYLGKIIVTRVWPSGWIGYLVSSVAALGILSLLLVHPIEERQENRWIRSYERWFYVALVPSIVMLLLAIWKRISQYGITEKRYFLVVLSVWLAGIALFFIFRRSRNIKVIPVTLCLVAFMIFGGPWGAYAVSRRSQTSRLERLLAANEMLSDGQVQPAPAALSFADRKELSAVVRYLAETHGTATLDPLFGGQLTEIDTVAPGLGPSDRDDADLRAELILSSLDVEYVGRWASGSEETFNFLVQPDGAVISVAGFDFGLRDWGATPDSVEIDGRSYVFELDEERSTIAMRRERELLIEVPLDPVIHRAREYRRTAVGAPHIPQDVFHVSAENERVRISVYARSVSGIVESPGEAEATVMEAGAVRYRITSFSADYYWAETAEAP